MTAPDRFLREPAEGAVLRGLQAGLLWAYAGAAVGVAAVGAVALVTATLWALGTTFGWAIADRSLDAILRAALVPTSAGVLAIVLVAAIGAAAYASTAMRSLPRVVVASAVAGVVGIAFLLLGRSGVLVAALGVGWALALPAEHPGRHAVRAAIPGLGALAFPPLGASVWWVGAFLVLGPALAAVGVLLGDLAWRPLRRLRHLAEEDGDDRSSPPQARRPR